MTEFFSKSCYDIPETMGKRRKSSESVAPEITVSNAWVESENLVGYGHDDNKTESRVLQLGAVVMSKNCRQRM